MFKWMFPNQSGTEGVTPSEADSSFNGHKALLIASALLVCLYSFVVLSYAQSVPDIGLRCAFSTDVIGFSKKHLAQPEQVTIGWKIVQIGDSEIRNWPEMLRAVRDLAPSPINGSTHRVSNGEEQVLVKLQPPANVDGTAREVWCRVDRSPVELLVPSVLWFFLKGGLFLVSLLVWWKRPADRPAAQFFVLSLFTFGAFMGGYHWWRTVTRPELAVLFIVSAVLLPAVNLHFYLIFPRPKEWLQRRPIWTLLATYGVPVIFLLAMLISYGRARWLVDDRLQGGTATDEQIDSALTFLLHIIHLYFLVAASWYLACVFFLLRSYWTAADSTERNQVKCILFGALLATLPIGYTLYLAFYEREDFGSGAATWPMFAASACITVAYTVSITRYRLMQIDQVLTSGVVYFLISLVAGLVYYALVLVGTLVFGRGSAGPSLGYALTVSTTALILTFVLDLARGRIQKALDRRFRKEKRNLDRTLQEMGETLEQLVDPPTLARKLLQVSAELLGVTRGSVFLREGHPPLYRVTDTLGKTPPLTELALGCPLVDALGQRPMLTLRHEISAGPDAGKGQLRFLGGEVAQALTHEGELLALLILGPKDSGPYGPEDFNLLAAFAHITALALENAERHRTIDTLNRDLQSKVIKISEQQRRILTLQSQLTRQTIAPSTESIADEPEMKPEVASSDGVRTGEKADPIVGSSPVMRQLLQLGKKVSQSPSAVLLRGESGTGKGLLARALHENSPRASKPFVQVHCAALSHGLLESELFGHVKGAFTGAHRDKIGRFELANGGTLFLDEIGDISLEVQTKLLRVLQETTFERVGSSDPVHVDVRILAATHQDLEQLIKQARFREDLYYRLNVISIQVPPLRDRREDIPELAVHFLRMYSQRCGRPVPQIDDDALVALKSFSWPGNIRQLENVMERAVVVAEGQVIGLQELPPELTLADGSAIHAKQLARARALTPLPRGSGPSRREERERREREELVRALAASAGNKTEAAKSLGLPRSTLLSKLKKFGLS